MWGNTSDQQKKNMVHLAAMALYEKWLNEVDVNEIFICGTKEIEEVIAEVAILVEDEEIQSDWIAFIRGDGKNEHRQELAEKCIERVKRKISRFSIET